jgi:hypothetical protein
MTAAAMSPRTKPRLLRGSLVSLVTGVVSISAVALAMEAFTMR